MQAAVSHLQGSTRDKATTLNYPTMEFQITSFCGRVKSLAFVGSKAEITAAIDPRWYPANRRGHICCARMYGLCTSCAPPWLLATYSWEPSVGGLCPEAECGPPGHKPEGCHHALSPQAIHLHCQPRTQPRLDLQPVLAQCAAALPGRDDEGVHRLQEQAVWAQQGPLGKAGLDRGQAAGMLCAGFLTEAVSPSRAAGRGHSGPATTGCLPLQTDLVAKA